VPQILHQFADDVLSLDSKFAHTLAALLARPGFLTTEYLAGRRARYVRPLRLYLVASLVYFVTLTVFDAADFVTATDTSPGDPAPGDSAHVAPDLARDDHGLGAIPIVGGRLAEQVTKLSQLSDDEARRTLNRAMLKNLPKGIFVLVPVFALVLRLFYVRRRRRYAEHFVFALHVHSFGFLALAVATPVPWEAVSGILGLSVPVYVVLAMRRVYAQGMAKTLAKAVGLALGYGILLVLTIAIIALVAVLTL
jgi:hypothetical protein